MNPVRNTKKSKTTPVEYKISNRVKKNKAVILIILCGILIAVFVFFLFTSPIFLRPETQETIINPPSETTLLETQTNNEGGVEIRVTPLVINDAAIWQFEITLDTHSGSLDADLALVSKLIDGQGNEFAPVSWTGDPLGGHHRQGILNFKPSIEKPRYFELQITGIGDIGLRRFVWEDL